MRVTISVEPSGQLTIVGQAPDGGPLPVPMALALVTNAHNHLLIEVTKLALQEEQKVRLASRLPEVRV